MFFTYIPYGKVMIWHIFILWIFKTKQYNFFNDYLESVNKLGKWLKLCPKLLESYKMKGFEHKRCLSLHCLIFVHIFFMKRNFFVYVVFILTSCAPCEIVFKDNLYFLWITKGQSTFLKKIFTIQHLIWQTDPDLYAQCHLWVNHLIWLLSL